MSSHWLRPLRPNRRPFLRPRARLAVASLEDRAVPTTVPFSLAGGDLMQNWTDPALIVNNDDWSLVPSITGYRGDDVTTQIGVDPQTILADASGVIDVNANQASPDTFTSGGMTEFDGIPDPTVAFQGSGTSDVPNLVFYLDASNRQNVRVRYTLRDIDGGADNSVQPVALQYRIGGTGDYVNLPAGFVADASSGPNLATLTTAVDVTLPIAADNQSLVEVRVLTTNAAGSDELIGIDDITISSEPRTSPGVLQFDTATYTVDEFAGTATITVTRTTGTVGAVSVQYATSDGTATAGSDYTTSAGTLNFADGQGSATFTVPITNDATQEPDETVILTLSNPTGGATLGTPNPATLTIVDNDAPGVLQFSTANFRRGENGGTATVTVTRTVGTGGAVSVQYATSDGTATAGSDYTATSGTLNFAAGQASATFTVAIADDTVLEGGETVNLTLTNATGGATLGTPATAILTVLDNDLLLNELEVDPPGAGALGTDEPFEYVELRGTPGASLAGYYFVSVEGEAGGPTPGQGVFDLVIDLSGQSLGSNGLLIIKAPAAGHTVIEPATTVLELPEFTTVGGILENFTNSFLIVLATSAPIVGTDYDTDDVLVEGSQFLGTLELDSIGGQVIDGAGFIDSSPQGELVYGVEFPSVFQFPAPAAATRLPNDLTPLSVPAFYYGELTFTTNTELAYDPQPGYNNAPTGAVLTPGGANFGAPAAAPTVEAVVVNAGQTNANQRSKVTSITVRFNTVVTFAGAVDAAFGLSRIGGGAVGGFTATANVVNGKTEVTLSGFTGAETQFGSLADGRYAVVVRANQVTAGGQQLDGDGNGTGGDDFTLNGTTTNGLFRLYGDVTGDGTVNAADFGPFRNAFGTSVGNPLYLDFLDVNGDGTINAFDFAQFRTRFGSSVP